MGDLPEIRGLFAVPLKLLCVLLGNRGPQFDNLTVAGIINKRKSISFLKGPYTKHYWPEAKACVNSILRFR